MATAVTDQPTPQPSRVRVVHLAAYGGSYPGSFIPLIEAARDATEARGWSFEAVFTAGVKQHPWYDALRASGTRVRVGPPMGRRAATGWVHALLREHDGPTVLHTHFSYWDLPAALARGASKRTAVVWHIHTPLSDRPLLRATNVIRFAAVGRAVDQILCVGPSIHDAVIGRLSPKGRTVIFPNGIDVARFAPVSESERRRARARLGLSDNAAVLVSFVWDWKRKGGPLLLETVRELQARGRHVVACLVGAPRDVSELGPRLEPPTGIRHIDPIDETRTLYAAADVFVAASEAEGMPFAVLESICCGTPVVVSDISSHRYVAVHMPGCRLTPRSASSFATAIESELDAPGPQRAGRLAESRVYIERQLTTSRWAQRLIELYAETIAARSW